MDATNAKTLTGVLIEREENWRDDSDGYALAWNGTAVERVATWTTRCGMDPVRCVPATPEEREAAAAWNEARLFDLLRAADREKSREVAKGKTVRVVRGRKVPLNTVGVIFYWSEQTFSLRYRNGYKQGPDSIKIGLALDEVKVGGRYVNVAWTYAHNVEVLSPDAYLTPDADLRLRAHAARENFLVGFTSAGLLVM